MLISSHKLPYVIAAALGMLCLEAVGLTLTLHSILGGVIVTFFFLIAVQSIWIALECWRVKKAAHLRQHWLLLVAGGLLNLAGLVLHAGGYLASLARHRIPSQIDYTDLLVVFAYIPIVILVSGPRGKPYPKSFFWIDAIQVILCGYLVYIKLFSIIPFTHTSVRPISFGSIIVFHAIVTFALGCAGILRFFSAITEDEKRFYRFFCWFWWINLFAMPIHNLLAVRHVYAGYEELLGVAPGLLFCIFVLYLPAESHEAADADSRNVLADFLNTASPAFFTLSLLLLSIDVGRTYFRFGMGTIIAAFFLHGLRATILQRNYEKSQQSLQKARRKLEELSLQDALTGVANRRGFDQTLESEWRRAIRAQHPLSLLLVDIDYFKNLNDRYGHSAGDDSLIQIAKALQSVLPRSSDFLARYGGEEFAAILPETDQDGAQVVAQKMQEAISELKIENESAAGRYATVSVGIATYVFPHEGSPGLLVEASDQALYRAKAGGRNRIEWTPLPFLSGASAKHV